MTAGAVHSAYVLHARPYRETSLLLDLFTPEGRVCAVQRGGRGRQGRLARPFTPLELSWRGRGELKTLSSLDACGTPFELVGPVLFSGLYLNELLVRLLPLEDAYPELFLQYELVLARLCAESNLQPALRAFEWQLLNALGYGFSLSCDAQGESVQAQCRYTWVLGEGLVVVADEHPDAFAGGALLALAAGDWLQPEALPVAKRLMRMALAPHLGERPLLSRRLFQSRNIGMSGEQHREA